MHPTHSKCTVNDSWIMIFSRVIYLYKATFPIFYWPIFLWFLFVHAPYMETALLGQQKKRESSLPSRMKRALRAPVNWQRAPGRWNFSLSKSLFFPESSADKRAELNNCIIYYCRRIDQSVTKMNTCFKVWSRLLLSGFKVCFIFKFSNFITSFFIVHINFSDLPLK